ncbi:OVARIAN TUMOR DOMAIN-containing deubiquitinating enzyme 12-like [Andrographis paniculata]|uniref:OVARIAN TUMOR DOMAIN-containing deubiquitinating enzyme 12-like n=1 Tax=Andrographis paniculata TaxID=175694 RepID=UPI0021E7DA93|nr:OVARIAN TUMOR DOMAIN-containing deubiquitinating enzyme 12-like [Andrographis paniculata]
MHQPEPDATLWSFFNIDNIFSNNYYGDSTQHDVKISHEQYTRDNHYETEYGNIENDEILAHALQEEMSQLSITESPELSHSGEEYLQSSTAVPNWPNTTNYNLAEDAKMHDTDDVGSVCSSPEDRSCDGDDSTYSLDITEDPNYDDEFEKRLYQMIPVPHVPKINGDIPSVDEATSDHQRLLDRLQLYDLIEHKVEGDGNCQFRALSDQIYRTPEHHNFVRQQVVRQLKAHPEIYEGYVPMDYANYLRRMSKSGEWGDHVTLQAAADLYGVRILVITSFKDTCYIEILPKDQKSKRDIYLSFWAEVHYNSIYPHGEPPGGDLKRKKRWWNFRNKGNFSHCQSMAKNMQTRKTSSI